MAKEDEIFDGGSLTCCPLCENENAAPYKRSREFGVVVYFCEICNHYSTWDLTHGIGIDDNASNKNRCGLYNDLINHPERKRKPHTPELATWASILEIGPGDYALPLLMLDAKKSKIKNITTIDVGTSFLDNMWSRPVGWKQVVKAAEVKGGMEAGAKALKKLQSKMQERIKDKIKILTIPNPTTPDEIYDVSFRMKESLEKEGRRWDLGISLHSLEHSPDPITMIQIFDDLCDDFIIEIPDGTSEEKPGVQLNRGHGMFVEMDDLGPFPVLPGKGKGEVKTKGQGVGGHYQLFTKKSLKYIAENHLNCHNTYYIGKAIGPWKTLVITTDPHFLESRKAEIVVKK